MDGVNSTCEEKEKRTQLFAAPKAKLAEAQKRAEKFAGEKEGHKACKELVQCAVLSRIIYGNGHWRLAEALANLAHGYLTLQGFPVQAIHHANSAKYMIFSRANTPPASLEEKAEILSTVVTIYFTLGVANLVQKKSRAYGVQMELQAHMACLNCLIPTYNGGITQPEKIFSSEYDAMDFLSANKECYSNLCKAERCVEELQGLDWKGTAKVSRTDVIIALGRACLKKSDLELAATYFEKAVDIVISAKGGMTQELIHIYQEITKIEQMKKNYEKSISYALQAHSVSLALYQKFSPEVGSTALFLGKAYAVTGEEEHAEAAEIYFNESLVAYKVALGIDHPQTITALNVFSKWLGQVGKRKQAYELLKESFKIQQNPCSDFNKQTAERLYIMGCICLAEEKIWEAYQLLSMCAQIQIAIYGSHHKKSKKIQELLDMLNLIPAVQEWTRCLKQDRTAALICSIPDL